MRITQSSLRRVTDDPGDRRLLREGTARSGAVVLGRGHFDVVLEDATAAVERGREGECRSEGRTCWTADSRSLGKTPCLMVKKC